MDDNSNYKTTRKKSQVPKIIGPDASGRMPPNARELEEAVLGAMMLERDKIHAVIEILTEAHFYAPENGKIFGSVNNIQIADEIKAAGFEVDRKAIKIIGGNPSNLGKFEADIKLFRDVDVKITFEVQEA